MKRERMGLVALAVIASLWASPVWAETAGAFIHSTATDGSLLNGHATLTDEATGEETDEGALAVSIQVSGAPPGKHGIHIHQFGDCSDTGKAAGGHYNPDGVSHGYLPDDGLTKAHAGDLGNIEIGQDGTGTLELTIPGLSVGDGPYTVAGRAIILHEKVDDFGQPTGNAGGRIGCGTIVITSE